jgi:hypothetical protein
MLKVSNPAQPIFANFLTTFNCIPAAYSVIDGIVPAMIICSLLRHNPHCGTSRFTKVMQGSGDVGYD